ncbi:MAG: SCO family protein [Thermodesulfobacteriota bacterium]
MNTMKKRSLLLILPLAALLVAGSAFYVYRHFRLKVEKGAFHGVLYDETAPGISLTDHNGEKLSLSDLRGKVVLLFFGYTHCPDICPTTLLKLKRVVTLLREFGDRVRVVFITVDPERDNPNRLKAYIPYFGKEFVGLTGSMGDIEKVAGAYNVIYKKEYDEDSKLEYLMGHTSSVYLIDPEGKLLLRYSQGKLDPAWVAEDLRKLLGSYNY